MLQGITAGSIINYMHAQLLMGFGGGTPVIMLSHGMIDQNVPLSLQRKVLAGLVDGIPLSLTKGIKVDDELYFD